MGIKAKDVALGYLLNNEQDTLNCESFNMYNKLIQSSELRAIINEPTTVIFDCRHELGNAEYGITSYRKGHIPNAIFACMDNDLSKEPNGTNGRHPLPDPRLLADWLNKCGVTNSTQVVAYDDAGGVYASRLWWLLKWLDHDAVAVLDGGLQNWMAFGGALDSKTTHGLLKGRFEVKLRDICVDAKFILKELNRREMVIIDARANDRFQGRNETIDPVAGHIPGAKNRFFKNNLDQEGKFRDAKELKASFKKIMGATPSHEVIHQCGSGVTACHNLLAMELAGLKNSKLYPGSWSEWISDPLRPISTG